MSFFLISENQVSEPVQEMKTNMESN